MALFLFIALLVGLYVVQGYAQNKGLKWIYGIVLVLLLSSVIVYYLLPESSQAGLQFASDEDIDKEYDSENVKFYEAVISGNISELDGVFLKDQWSFDYSESDGDLEIPDYGNLPMIGIERKQMDDGKIEVLHYTTPIVLGALDLTEKIGSFRVSLEGQILHVDPPEEISISVTGFKKDFVVTQFSEEKADINYSSFAYGFQDQVLYVRIPKNVQVKEPDRFHFVGEEGM